MMKFFKKKNINPEAVELEYTEKEFMEKRYEWLKIVRPDDEIHSSYKWTVICLLKDFDKRISKLEKVQMGTTEDLQDLIYPKELGVKPK